MKKINLVEKVTMLDEFREMVKQNTYPLAVILDEAEFEIYNFGLENNTLFPELPSFQELMYCYGDAFRLFVDMNYVCFQPEMVKKREIRIHTFTDKEGKREKIRRFANLEEVSALLDITISDCLKDHFDSLHNPSEASSDSCSNSKKRVKSR